MLYSGFCAGFGTCFGLVTGRALSAMVPVRHLYLKCCGEVFGGVLLSLCFGLAAGWHLTPADNISYVAVFTAMALLLIECYQYYQYYLSIPVTLIDESMREKENGAQSFPTNLTLMDFAGDEEYYSMHHIFLAHEAVYLLVFSLVEAVRNQNRTLERLLFWLHSVKTHASSEDCAVFLVGTHRDSVTSLQRQDVATFLSKNLYRSTCFSSLLVLNADHTPLFPVENSKPVDEDMICLRDAIWTMTQQANYVRRQLPIRWLKFLEVMKRTEKPIISLDNLRQECSQIGLENEEEFYDVLTTFDQAGDIIYQGNDETLKNYVVLDPQLLVDAMAKITCPQPTHIGMPKYVEHLTLLEKKGIVRSDFIHSAVAQLNIDEPSVLLKLLVAYDMLCPLGEEADCDPGHTTYLVPSRLPEYNPKLHRSLSERHGDDDQIFYIDFETFNPDVVYTRVVARCLALCKVKEKTHTRTHVFRNVGCFNVANRFWFTIEPMRPAPDQNVLKITVTSATGSNPFDLLGMLHDILEAIRRRDFPNMSYTSGVCCPFEAPHSDYTEPERIHVLKLAGSGEMFPNESHPLMFLCCGREHQVARAMSTAVSRRSRPQTQLQYSHIQQLALLLDPPRVLGNDWKGLADHLGYGVTEILNFQRTESPTMALLIDYGTKVDKFEAARKITEGLELLGRLDAVAVMTANVNRGVSHDEDK
ncbi:leucine-rich repeat serine/threonine-protein kinase 2-like [Branchiostoma floridae]|uniref:Leucine-rich repeat serine/threonine-protein kinase 2-like n=1 Tax=Branchiostoma floridae TaxID=7739 RepID=A0A9J7HIE1_BRAFL|nr:leucine-rich repeat serine/threonine-protein kinase 2-like [Branchiostoma floridae]